MEMDSACSLKMPPPKKQLVHDYIARQFAMPVGKGGIAVAAAMRVINWLPYKGAIDLLDPRPASDLLEVGHGPGVGLRQLAKMATLGSVTGIDPSSTMRRLARANNASAITEGRMSLKQGTFEHLPLPDMSVDGILAVNVLYFVDPLSLALTEARRVLRPGGSLAVYVTDKSHMSWLQFEGRETKHAFDKRSLYRILQASDFGEDKIDIRSVWLPFRFRGILAKITKSV